MPEQGFGLFVTLRPKLYDYRCLDQWCWVLAGVGPANLTPSSTCFGAARSRAPHRSIFPACQHTVDTMCGAFIAGRPQAEQNLEPATPPLLICWRQGAQGQVHGAGIAR